MRKEYIFSKRGEFLNVLLGQMYNTEISYQLFLNLLNFISIYLCPIIMLNTLIKCKKEKTCLKFNNDILNYTFFQKRIQGIRYMIKDFFDTLTMTLLCHTLYNILTISKIKPPTIQ